MAQAKADVNIGGGQFLPKMTPLHEAALHSDASLAKLLIENKADVHAKAYWERTPLLTAMADNGSADDPKTRAAMLETVKVSPQIEQSNLQPTHPPDTPPTTPIRHAHS